MHQLKFKFSEFSGEIRILWTVSVLVSVLIISASFYLTADDINSGVISFLSIPHDSCLFCGMSHSLVMMSRGGVGESFSWNAAGPPLYIFMIVNTWVWMTSILGRPMLKKFRGI